MNSVIILGFFEATIRMTAPLLITALGCLLAERAGLLNIGLEGQMLCGAFFAYLAVYFGASLWVGVLAAILVGALMGLAFAYLTVTKLTNQMIVGAAFNMFALGLTGFVFRASVGVTGTTNVIDQFIPVEIPLLSKIPIVGAILFQQNVLVYIFFLMVPLVWYFLNKTAVGFQLRAIGEHPRAVDSLGVDVIKYKYIAVLVQGAFAGMGGAYLTLAYARSFVENLTAGRGFIALTSVIFGGWTAWGSLGGCLVFGAADALQLRMQSMGVNIPYHLLLMLPYLLTVIILAGALRKAKPPAMETVPYDR